MAGFAANYGHYNDIWRKNPIQLGYGGIDAVKKIKSNAGAGTITVTASTLASDFIYVLNHIAAFNETSVPTKIEIEVKLGGLWTIVGWNDTLIAGQPVFFSSQLVQEGGDAVRAKFYGTTSGDKLVIYYSHLLIPLTG